MENTLNGVFTQTSNRRHRQTGHLFQGRYKAILVDADPYLLELTRYVVLNPVRAGIVDHPGKWMWSSYNGIIGQALAPSWLATDELLAQFSSQRKTAVLKYIQFVNEGIGEESIWKRLNRQIFLGDDHFVTRMQQKVKGLSQDINIPKAQRRPPAQPLAQIAKQHDSRNQAIVSAYATGEYSYQQIAAYFNLHFTTIGRIVRTAKVNGMV